MRINKIRLKNYIGVYNGMGLKELEIDFTTHFNKVNLIIGGNGSGKTTLMDSLHPFSGSGDRPRIIIDGLKGEKEIIYDHNGVTYTIYHEYTPNKTGHNVKSYIKRGETELNPNGNVGSFEELVKDNLGIDRLGLRLAKMSSSSSSIVNMTDSERKKYITDIQPSLELMISIHKRMVEKHKDIKTLLTRVSSKLSSIGDMGDASIRLDKMNIDIERVKNMYTDLRVQYNTIKNDISGIDYDTVVKRLSTINNRLENISAELRLMDYKKSKYNISDMNDLNNKRDSHLEALTKYKNDKINMENRASVLLSEISNLQSLIVNKESFINNTKSSLNTDQYRLLLAKYEEELSNIDLYVPKVNPEFSSIYNASDILSVENILGKLVDMVTDLYSSIEYGDEELKEAIYGSDAFDKIHKMHNEINQITEDIESNSSRIFNLRNVLKSTEILKNKPDECTISSCIFIRDALKVDIVKTQHEIDRLIDINEANNKKIASLNDRIHMYTASANSRVRVSRILDVRRTASTAVSRLPISCKELIMNEELFKSKLSQREIYIEHNLCDLIEVLDYDNRRRELIDKIDSCKDKLEGANKIDSIVNEYTRELHVMKATLTSNKEEYESCKHNIRECTFGVEKYEVSYNDIKNLSSIMDKITEMTNEHASLLKEADSIRISLTDYSNGMNRLSKLSKEIEDIKVTYKTLSEDRDTLVYKSKSIEKYEEEKKELEERYAKISLLKDISSSTKGIPIIYTDIYIKDTRKIANRLLTYILKDEYELLPFIVDDKSFKIPCRRGYDKKNDDISTMSAGEKSIMTLVLSVALLVQCGTEYNILLLDEIDGPLDVEKKEKFIMVLESIMELLEIEQVFVISHSNQFDAYSCNIIALNGSEMNNINNSDIIFKI